MFRKKIVTLRRFYVHVCEQVMNNNKIGFGLWALALCLLAPVFLYAQAAHVSLGASVSSATLIEDTVTADVNEGAENYFKIEAEHLPATVCYFPDTAFGPIPVLVSIVGEDTLPATMISENCRMGWRWTLAEAGEEETERYLYFSAHENNATAEIRPYIFTCPVYEITLPSVAACDEYVWGDTTIYDSGTYTRHFTASNGCDSTVTLTVTINESSDPTNINITAYDKYVWHGLTVTKSGYAGAWEGTNAAGCDSVVNLIATIRHLVKDTVRQTICSNELPYMWHGLSCEANGTYSTDTIMGPEVDKIYRDSLRTLILTVNQAYAVDTVAELCGTSYTWRGQNYTSSGNYPFTAHTAAGCDSVITLQLTLKAATASEETRTEYESYTWNGKTYTASGTYTYSTTNAAGCDSTATLYLTIKERPVVSYDTVFFCSGFNTEHEEQVEEALVLRYLPYVYQSPATWDYKSGMVIEQQRNRTRFDLNRVEQNLMNHYIGELEPVSTITWTYQAYGETTSRNIDVTSDPQWIESGDLMIYVRFMCGHSYQEKTVIERSTEGFDAVMDGNDNQSTKVLIDGQLYIIRGGVKYTIFGARVE